MYKNLKIHAVRKHDEVHKTDGWSVSSHYNKRVTFRELLHKAFRNSTFSIGEAIGIVTQLIEAIEAELKEGNLVEIDGLGTFYPQASAPTVATIDELEAQNVVVRIMFRAVRAFKRSLPYKPQWLHGRKDNSKKKEKK